MFSFERPVSYRQVISWARKSFFPSLHKGPAPNLATILAIEGLLAAIVGNLATGYTQMFAARMGATNEQIGYISALPQLLALLVLIPGAILASRNREQRRPVEATIVLYGVLYGIAGFSPWLGNYRVWFLIGAISLANAPVALYGATWQSYFSDIVPFESRNAYYTRRTSMVFFASIIVVQAVGIILGSAKTDEFRIWLYQSCYWLAFIIAIVQMRVLRRAPGIVRTQVSTGWRDLLAAGREMIHCRGFVLFCLISLFYHFGMFMSWPLFFINQVTYLGANETWISLLAVPASIIQWLTVRPWGRFIEKHGFRLALVIGSFGLALNPLVSALAAYFPTGWKLPGMMLLNLVFGGTFTAYMLSMMQCLLEVVPSRYRTISISVYTTLILVMNAVAPIIGVRIYVLLGSDLKAMTLSMLVSSIIRFIGGGLFLLRWHLLRSRHP